MVTTSEIDYRALFAAVPTPCLVLDRNLVIADANPAYLRLVDRDRADLVGRHVVEALAAPRSADRPDRTEESGDPAPSGPVSEDHRSLERSLARVVKTGESDAMAPQRCGVPFTDRSEACGERSWAPVNTPVFGADGRVRWIVHRMEEVTISVGDRTAEHGPGAVNEREYAQELERLNEELRRAHSRERLVAVALQEAMLQAPDLERHENIAVRYLPATGSLNVCGDWYDTVDLADGRFYVAVGDVVGHGLEAASVMGMLRSALSAASRAVTGPALAVEVLGLYARSVEGALATTTVAVLVDPRSRLIIYSNAGHPPPVLLHPDGSLDLLDRATDPPLGARPEHVPRAQAGIAFDPGDTLVLYTDGLIERRDEDIDAGLKRLTDALVAHRDRGSEDLADAVLAQLGVSDGANDDIALVVVGL